jgi:hypothetical protein
MMQRKPMSPMKRKTAKKTVAATIPEPNESAADAASEKANAIIRRMATLPTPMPTDPQTDEPSVRRRHC